MIIANDMALLTFLPLGYIVLSSTGKEKYMAFTFIMQNISANLGGMLTPFGNPQNLYLYEKFNIPTGEFMSIMLIPFAVSIALVTLCCLFVPNEKLSFSDKEDIRIPVKKAIVYGVLFVLVIASVFRALPYWVGLATAVPVLLIMDRDALKKVDYPLLITFAAFFVFSGNMARIDAVDTLLTRLLEMNTLLVSVASCQVMSNVPSAILLSQFTTDYPALLIGVNIGGAGTLIASLASLITFREYSKQDPGHTLRYIVKFSLFNFAFLGILILICSFL
jgi:Na+/H+ antiporter NhaD/arsenite permease-like protein